jgi:hypothetical protein
MDRWQVTINHLHVYEVDAPDAAAACSAGGDRWRDAMAELELTDGPDLSVAGTGAGIWTITAHRMPEETPWLTEEQAHRVHTALFGPGGRTA